MALERYDRNMHFNDEVINNMEERIKVFNMLVKGNIVDIGCGCGYSGELINNNNSVIRYLGLDYDKDTIKENIMKFGSKKVEFKHFDINKDVLDFDFNIDVFLCIEFMEHIEKNVQISLLNKIKDVFDKQGYGRFVGTTPMVQKEGKSSVNEYHLYEHTFESFNVMVKNIFPRKENYKIFCERRYNWGHYIFFDIRKGVK